VALMVDPWVKVKVVRILNVVGAVVHSPLGALEGNDRKRKEVSEAGDSFDRFECFRRVRSKEENAGGYPSTEWVGKFLQELPKLWVLGFVRLQAFICGWYDCHFIDGNVVGNPKIRHQEYRNPFGHVLSPGVRDVHYQLLKLYGCR